jgi:UDP-3-O-[3-hydroxymyristoyl] glucosamine N-acyltransferase
MRLSDLTRLGDVRVARDGQFRTLGFLPQVAEERLVFLEDARFAATLARGQGIGAVITKPELAASVPSQLGLALAAEPRKAFALIHNHLAATGFYWTEFATVIDPGAQVHPAAWVAGKNVRIGAGTVVGPHSVILERCAIEDNVTVGAGVVLGGAGFQTVRTSRPMIELRHAGGLTIRAGAYILDGAVVATGLFHQSTTISQEARIGARAFVSHAVQVGERSFVGHGAVINGNVTIGADVWVGPGAVVSNDLQIGSRASISLGSVVIRDVPCDARVSGNFAVPHRRHLRQLSSKE